MNPELKKKWVEALRSGEYKQGQEKLRPTVDTFCCLGVLLNIIDPDGWVGPRAWGETEVMTCLPREINIQAGIDAEHEVQLTRMNDGCEEYAGAGKTFPEIADWIEENL